MRTSAVGANKHHGDHDANFAAAAAAAAAADDDETNAKTSLSGSGISLPLLRPQEAQSTDGEMFKTTKPTTKKSGSTGTTARSPRHPQAQQHPYSSSAFHEGNRWMGGSVGCSVFEEHHRAGIERERERTNQREGQKYDNHMLAIWLSGAANVTRAQKMRLSQWPR